MDLYRIGDKVVSRSRLAEAIDAILVDRAGGATQEEAARRAGVQRSFVSFLETLGELRRGPRVALVAFPVKNAAEVRELAGRHALDFVLVLDQAQRESIEGSDASTIFNELLQTLAALQEFDTVILAASDMRLATIDAILRADVIGIPLGPSPIRDDVEIDLAKLEEVIRSVVAPSRPPAKRRTSGMGRALADAADLAGRWTASKRS